jgi:uncharacterized protein YcgI (DUF1989 family)
MNRNRTLLREFILQPATGKATPVYRGQILHIEQVRNGQVMDFNAFNLHDYKEHFSSLKTLNMETAWPTAGHRLWTNGPRERPMCTIIADTAGTNDVLAGGCSAFIMEYVFGVEYSTNCTDIHGEAIREYGLTPDDVHGSFNGFMRTGLDEKGRLIIKRGTAKKGDYLELISHFDTLAVPVACGASLMSASNYELKPLRVVVYEATDEEKARWLEPEGRRYRNQRVPEEYLNPVIKATRELAPDPKYSPMFRGVPLETRGFQVEFTPEEYSMIEAVRGGGEVTGSDGEIVRSAFFNWVMEYFVRWGHAVEPAVVADPRPRRKGKNR